MKTLSLKKHGILFSIIVVVIGLSFLLIGDCLFEANTLSSVILRNLVGRITPTVLLLLLLVKLGILKNEKEKTPLIRGVLMGVPILIIFIALEVVPEIGHISFSRIPDYKELLSIIFDNLCVGGFEETLFRAGVFGILMWSCFNKKDGILKAALVSSFMFGSLHLINLFSKPQLLLGTIAQVFYAAFLGIFFCALYIKTKNLWVIALIHAFLDMNARLLEAFSPFLEQKMAHDFNPIELILQCIILSPLAIWGVHYLKQVCRQDSEKDSSPLTRTAALH